MTLPSVQINNLNLGQGGIANIDNYFLFVGSVTTPAGELHYLDNSSDLDVLFGSAVSPLKTTITNARLNAGTNWHGIARTIGTTETAETVIDQTLDTSTVEGIVICDPAISSAALDAWGQKAVSLATQARRVFIMVSLPAHDPATQTWADYVTASAAISDSVFHDRLICVAPVFGSELGILAGRLSNSSVSIADTPYRTKTGSLVGLETPRPLDSAGIEINSSHISALEAKRLSVPMWFDDFDGNYWSEANTLAVEGSDYSILSYLRVIDKASRAVRKMALQRIGDRTLNNTPQGSASAIAFFTQPLTKMAAAKEIEPPTAQAVALAWSGTSISVYLTLRPFKAPKNITVNLSLDLSDAAAVEA